MGCSDCNYKSTSQTDQNEYNFGNCCCRDMWTNSDSCDISLQATINTNWYVYESYVTDYCTNSACTNMYCRWLQEDVSITSNTHCCTMCRSQSLKQMVNKSTHDSWTRIDHLYMSQTQHTIQTDVTDCYYSDHDCILCWITS